MKNITISRDQIKAWNRLGEAMRGKSNYYVFTLYHEYKDTNGRWKELGHGLIRNARIDHPSDKYFIKKIKDETWIYFTDCSGDQERWYLSDVAKAYFNIEDN